MLINSLTFFPVSLQWKYYFQIRHRLREKEERLRQLDLSYICQEKFINNENENDNNGNKNSKTKNHANSISFLSSIYEKNIICPTALYLFKECSVLCMPFAELG